jgi:hypothetical protein
MNSIASLLFTMAATMAGVGQLGNGGTPPGVKAGWKIESDGSMSYIGQVTSEIAQQMSTQGQEMALDIPDFLQGRVSRIVWRIGSEEVEREPSEAELRAMPARQVLPPGVGNGLTSGGLTSLSDRSSAITVPIDSPRPSAMTMPALGTARAADSDPTLPPVPSLAQSYASPTARAAQANSGDMFRSGVNTGSVLPSLGMGPGLPGKDTLPPGTSKPVFGPQLPPAGYTGGPITVTGSSAGTGAGNNWNDARLGATSGQYANSNSLANGNFGNPNNFGANTGNTYSAPQSSIYPNGSQANSAAAGSPNNSLGYAGTNGQFNSTAQPTYSNAYARPDAQIASSNPGYASPYPAINPQQQYPPNGQVANAQGAVAAQPWNAPYTMPATNYSAMPNTGAVPSTVPYMASATQPPPTVTRNMVDGTRRTTSSSDDDVYPSVSATPPSYVVALLLASLVGNFYLVMLLNQLLQRYRSLQASSRGSTSLAM